LTKVVHAGSSVQLLAGYGSSLVVAHVPSESFVEYAVQVASAVQVAWQSVAVTPDDAVLTLLNIS
jgi:hypothetical protein